ncbi:MAG: ComEC/Rec2 family competence protein [candidate division WOR-3 bacterium]|nr:MAG: ComEC/Rec2 family competence protein [candidate division WOR-3 bacterium]
MHRVCHFPFVVYIVIGCVALILSFWDKRFLFVVVSALVSLNAALMTSLQLNSDGPRLTFVGVVVGEDHFEQYTKLSIDVKKIFLKNDTMDYFISTTFYTPMRATYLGKILIIKGIIRPASVPDRPHILTGSIIGSYPPQNVLNTIFYNVRKYVDTSFKNVFNAEHYNVASGLILGGSSRIGEELREIFARAGIIHILAVSGLHVGFVCFFIGLILVFVPVSPKIKFAIMMLALLLYAGITGFRPSVCRASAMAFLFGLAIILQRNVSPLHVLNLTAIMFLLGNPLLLFDVGAQLSFAAVYGILFLYPRIDTLVIKKIKKRLPQKILMLMALSFSAQIFVSPLLIYYFHRLPTLAVISNVIIVPLASMTVFLLISCLFIGIIFMPVAKIIGIVITVLLTILVTISKAFAHIPFSAFALSISPIILFLLYPVFFRKTRRFAIWSIVIVLILFSIASLEQYVIIKVAPTGALISMPSGTTIFVTRQRGSTANAAFLTHEGVDKVDYLIAPNKVFPAEKRFLALPERLHFKRVALNELSITMERDITIMYHEQRIILDRERGSDEDILRYIITDGKDIYRLNTALHSSVLDHMSTEVRVLFTKLRLLF